MGNILDNQTRREESEWLTAEKNMKFYCSYCMLTGTNPKVVTIGNAQNGNNVGAIFAESDLKHKMSITTDDTGTNYTVILYVQVNPYDPVDAIVSALLTAMSSTALSCISIKILESVNYITIKIGVNDQVYTTISTYKHTGNTLESALATIKDFKQQKAVNTKGEKVATICYLAEYSKPPTKSIIPSLFKASSFNDMSLEYTLPEGAKVCNVSLDHIEKCMFESIAKIKSDVTEEQLSNFRQNIQHIHTALGVPALDPYTRHGSIPIEYKRMWSFVWCCSDELPKCQFAHLCKQIFEIYFLLAERHIEEYIRSNCSTSKPLKEKESSSLSSYDSSSESSGDSPNNPSSNSSSDE
jgi:hypothetical protein